MNIDHDAVGLFPFYAWISELNCSDVNLTMELVNSTTQIVEKSYQTKCKRFFYYEDMHMILDRVD